MTDYDELLGEAFDMCRSSAWTAAKRWGRHADRDDIQQELAVWCLRHPHKIEEWLSGTDDERKRGQGKLGLTLRREADKYVRREKASAAGYSVDDEFFYNTGIVDAVLPGVLEDDWTEPPAPEDSGGRGSTPISERGNWQVMCADVNSVLTTLPVVLRTAVDARYGALDVEAACALTATDPRGLELLAERALNLIVERLGGKDPWLGERVGTRRVISNAESLDMTRRGAV
jgi:hypothetical protein